MNKHTLIIAALLISGMLQAQDKTKFKFGDISPKDFEPKAYAVDSNASAVVLADIGSGSIEGNRKSGFSEVFKHYRRARILNKNGYDLADVQISLYTSGSAEEQLDKLKAVTYNLENGKVVETKLDLKSGVFEDKISKNTKVKKFTLPNIREGSIIEWEYSTTSDFITHLEPWIFQGAYPRIWSEFSLAMPEFLNYVFLTQGYQKYDIQDRKDRRENFSVMIDGGADRSENYKFDAIVTDYRWVMKDVPELKVESFTSTLDNHIAKIEFQLSEQRNPLTYRNIMGTWKQVADELMQSEYFGLQLKRDNGWMNDITDPLVKGVKEPLEKARRIYNYVRDNFTCTNHRRVQAEQNLKALVKSKNGTVAEINLLLTALLLHEDLKADPVILSTRDNGVTYSMYPLLNRFNYVITQLTIDDKPIYLDASEPHLGFGLLPLRCYNGHARVMDAMASAIELLPESVNEKSFASAFIVNDEKGNLVGSMQYSPGYYESYGLREEMREKGKTPFTERTKKGFGVDVELSNVSVDSLDKVEFPLAIRYDFDIKQEKDDILYINPMFGNGYKENPFKSAVRRYPVEMPHVFDETYTLQLEVPQGYVVDELPKQAIVKLDEDEGGMFEYRITQSGSNISLRSRLVFKRTYFLPEEYENLREFYNMVVAKQSEQIVFKKKK